MVLSSSADNFTTRVAWMFSRRLKMRVKPLGMSREQNRRYKIGYLKILLGNLMPCMIDLEIT